jgi:hypothetical protein
MEIVLFVSEDDKRYFFELFFLFKTKVALLYVQSKTNCFTLYIEQNNLFYFVHRAKQLFL